MIKVDSNCQACHLDWDSQTVFKDAVLEYISMPKAVAHKLVDHKIFQRLRDVAQTGMEALYPGATHNRFCHSVGVYHLGKLAFQNFQQNVKKQHKKIYYRVAETTDGCERVWNRWRFLFETACLLHDCGHAPLSHGLEFLYDAADSETGTDDADILNKRVNADLLKAFDGNGNFRDCFIKRDKKTGDLRNEVYGAPHERMSSCLIITGGEDGYKDILKELIADQMRYFEETVLSKSSGVSYSDEEFMSDLEFMSRMIIGCKYNLESEFKGEEEGCKEIVFQLRNCIINLLHGVIDVDNIDYSIRDATASGYKSTQVDYERLLKSNTIALAYEQEALELKGEQFSYSVCLKQFVSDQVTEDSPLFMTISGSATLVLTGTEPKPGIKTEKGPETGTTGKEHIGLKITGNIWEDDEHNSDKQVRVIHIREESSINLELWNGKLEIRPRSRDLGQGTQLYLYSKELRGKLTGTVFVGNQTFSGEHTDDLQTRIQAGKMKIVPAYHKSALSVIQGALDAANFESRWIYSHHVTTYYNNFLNVFLLEKYADFCVEEEYCELLRQTNLFLDYLERFKGRGGECERDPEADEKLELAKNELKNAKDRLESQRSRREGESGTNNSEDGQESVKRGEIKGVLPEHLPDLKHTYDWEIFNTLLSALAALCRPIPVGWPMPHEEEACGAIGRIIDVVNHLAEPSKDAAKLSVLEDKAYQEFRKQITSRAGIRIYGMPTMNALLGMKDSKMVNGRRYFRTSDADLRSMYHSLAQNATEEQKKNHKDLFHAIKQYESRDYLTPMWKSHAEFHFYVQGWKDEWFQKQEVETGKKGDSQSWIERFFNNMTAPSNDKDVSMYTYFSEREVYSLTPDLAKFWTKVRKQFPLDILVYVPQKIKHKQLSDDGTYVIWKDRVVTLKDIGLQTNQADAYSYFYFYYRLTENTKPLDILEFMDFLKKELDDWVQNAQGKSGSSSYKGEQETEQEKQSETEAISV